MEVKRTIKLKESNDKYLNLIKTSTLSNFFNEMISFLKDEKVDVEELKRKISRINELEAKAVKYDAFVERVLSGEINVSNSKTPSPSMVQAIPGMVAQSTEKVEEPISEDSKAAVDAMDSTW